MQRLIFLGLLPVFFIYTW